MTAEAGERTAFLAIRVWVEGEDARLRARITSTLDVATREESSTAAATRDEIKAVIDSWLDDFLRVVTLR